MRGINLRSLLALILIGSLPACSSLQTDHPGMYLEPEVLQSPVKVKKEYVLAAGDQLEVSVWRVPEASRAVTIAPDGFIILPIAGDVQAAGLTVNELAVKLRQLYSARLVNPDVRIFPTQIRQPVVYVLGDVNTQSAIPLRNATTVVQALAYAGGVRRTGAEADISIIRLSKDGYLQAIPIAPNAAGQPGPYLAASTIRLQADDVIFVPEHGRSQVVRFLDDIVLKPLQMILNYKLLKQLDASP